MLIVPKLRRQSSRQVCTPVGASSRGEAIRGCALLLAKANTRRATACQLPPGGNTKDMLVSRTLITLVPLISAGCVGFRRSVGRICENLRQICGICVPLCQAVQAGRGWRSCSLSQGWPRVPCAPEGKPPPRVVRRRWLPPDGIPYFRRTLSHTGTPMGVSTVPSRRSLTRAKVELRTRGMAAKSWRINASAC